MATLHEILKYVDDKGEVQTLIAERHTFKGIENYYTDSMLYQDLLNRGIQLEKPDSDNEADAKLKNEDCLWELDLSVIGQNNLDANNTAYDDGAWYYQ